MNTENEWFLSNFPPPKNFFDYWLLIGWSMVGLYGILIKTSSHLLNQIINIAGLVFLMILLLCFFFSKDAWIKLSTFLTQENEKRMTIRSSYGFLSLILPIVMIFLFYSTFFR